MTKRFLVLALAALVTALFVPQLVAQNTGTVKGVCKDVQGNPIAGATVEWLSPDTGRKYDIKTNKKGEYFSLGIAPGTYNVKLIENGKEVYHFNNVHVQIDETTMDFDLKKEQAAQAAAQGMTAEQLKQREEEAAKIAKENANVKSLNDKLASARADIQAGNPDQAVTTLTEATQIDPNRDIIWASLADAERAAGLKKTDSADKSKMFNDAVQSYQKAIQLKQTALQGGQKDPNANKTLAGYYNNLGDALAKSGKTDDAIKAYEQAAQTDPTNAGSYYFNEGAIMTNNNKVDEAIQAFDKAIAADPNKAEAYYWKGVNLIAKATTDKSGKVIPAPGTAEALNKYLELQPTGQFAEGAKGMLQMIGSTVETTYGKKKAAPTKKKP